MLTRYPLGVMLWAFVFVNQGFSQDPSSSLEEKLQSFYENPRYFLNTLPEKTDAKGRVVHGSRPFPSEFTSDRQFFIKREEFRVRNLFPRDANRVRTLPLRGERVHAPIEGSPEEFATYDKPEDLIEGGGSLVRNVFEMDRMALREQELPARPWSDDYWPIYRGVLGARYADTDFMSQNGWKGFFDFISARPSTKIVENGTEEELQGLSPSEKYDLLLGGEKSPLTDQLWKEGKGYFERDGDVERWMGICHGWAPASYMEARPLHKIEVSAANGRSRISFYPADIRALISLVWAKTRTPVRFIGGRCSTKDVKTDDVGRIIENDCFDMNPGSWHMAVVNQVGIKKRSFILDATFDYEVWNQPVFSYSYRYFNPQTLKETSSLDEAVIGMDTFARDEFKKYRARDAKKIVGVNMRISYGVENRPRQYAEANPEREDRSHTVSYVYDLELDKDGKILGGEWYNNAHPDFLWTPTSNAKPMAMGDYHLLGADLWDGQQPLEERWRKLASQSAIYGQPLNKIVQSLLKLSTRTQ
ncbi:MAG: hypothetical protein HYW48_05285 [Deltaproteobacteria bacterium]|nr:hypothetical protein [Deltaproteobacteria bacterium]